MKTIKVHIFPNGPIDTGYQFKPVVDASEPQTFLSMKTFVERSKPAAYLQHKTDNPDLFPSIGIVQTVERDPDGIWAVIDIDPERQELVEDLNWKYSSSSFIPDYRASDGAVYDIAILEVSLVKSPRFSIGQKVMEHVAMSSEQVGVFNDLQFEREHTSYVEKDSNPNGEQMEEKIAELIARIEALEAMAAQLSEEPEEMEPSLEEPTDKPEEDEKVELGEKDLLIAELQRKIKMYDLKLAATEHVDRVMTDGGYAPEIAEKLTAVYEASPEVFAIVEEILTAIRPSGEPEGEPEPEPAPVASMSARVSPAMASRVSKPLDFDTRVEQYRTAHKCSYREALQAVTNQN